MRETGLCDAGGHVGRGVSPAAMSRASWRRSRPPRRSRGASGVDRRRLAESSRSVRSNRDPAGSTCSTTPLASRGVSGGVVGVRHHVGRVEDGDRATADDVEDWWSPSEGRPPPRCPRRRPSRAAGATGTRSSAVGRSGCAARSAGRSRVESSKPRPAATWVIRCFGVAPPTPKATMCEDWMLAPALVPAMTTPRSCAARIASPNGVPLMIAESFSWLPPVMKMPVASSSTSTKAGSRRLFAGLGPGGDDLGGAQLAEDRVVDLDDLGAERRSRRDDRDPRSAPPRRATNSREHGAPAELVLGAADDHQGPDRPRWRAWHDMEA